MKNTQDLLHGNIKSELIALTIPLVLGNILQQFYNTIDSFIVGRYVGKHAGGGAGGETAGKRGLYGNSEKR